MKNETRRLAHRPSPNTMRARSWVAGARLTGLWLLLGSAACGSDSTDGSTQTKVPADRIHEALGALQCDLLTSCPVTGDAAFFGTLIAASDKAACTAFINRLADNRDENIEAKVQSGALSYDPEKLAQCMAMARENCMFDVERACRSAFEGKVAPGGRCESDLDCAGDANCVFGSDPTCGGTCRARVARGEACEFDGDCSQEEGPSACSWNRRVCVAIERETDRELGQPCGKSDEATGYFERTCKRGLLCVYGEEGGTCASPLSEGASCSGAESRCAAGTICQPGSAGATCQPLTLVRTVGASCNHDPSTGPLVLCSPIDQLGCDQGKCRKWGDGSAGQYCSTDFETNFACNRGLYCADDTCQSPKAEGQPCARNEECSSGWCNFMSPDGTWSETGTCAPSPTCQ